jgi:hypothetical protein
VVSISVSICIWLSIPTESSSECFSLTFKPLPQPGPTHMLVVFCTWNLYILHNDFVTSYCSTFIYLFIYLFIYFGSVLLCSPSWPQALDPPASAFWMLGRQMCTIIPGPPPLYILVGLGFEFRSLHLQSRCSTVWATPPVYIALVILGWDLVNYLLGLASNLDPLVLSLPSS